jgi:hypothetical protein
MGLESTDNADGGLMDDPSRTGVRRQRREQNLDDGFHHGSISLGIRHDRRAVNSWLSRWLTDG